MPGDTDTTGAESSGALNAPAIEITTTALMEAALDSIVLMNQSGLILGFNPVAEQMFGYSTDEVLGKEMAGVIIPPYLREAHRTGLARFGRTGEGVVLGRRVELTGMRRNGEEFPLELSLTRLPGQEPVIFVGFMRDLSAQKQSESWQRDILRALNDSEDRLRLSLEATGLGTWDYYPQTGILRWDSRCKALFGLSPNAPVDYNTFLAGIHPEDRERSHQAVQNTLSMDSGGEFAISYRTIGLEDGIERWLAARGRAFFDESGQATRFTGTVLDITAQKQTEEALRQERDFATVLTTHLAEGIYAVDADGRFTFINPLACRMLGWEAPELLGKHAHTAIHYRHEDGSPYPPEECPLLRVLTTGGTLSNSREVFIRKEGTMLPVLCSSAPLTAEGRITGAVVAFSDLTEQLRVEQQIQHLLEQAQTRATQEALLNQLGQRLRDSDNLQAALKEVMAALGSAVGADRCYYAQYDLPHDYARIDQDWHRDDLPSLAGEYTISDFQLDLGRVYRPGVPLLMTDVREQPGFSAIASRLLETLGMRAGISIPLFEQDHLVASLGVSMAETPRDWTPEEVSLLRAAAPQIRAAIESARLHERERNIATQLQDALRPDLPLSPPRLDLTHYYRPALEEASIGGDFFDVFALEPECIALVVADLSGKGLAAAAQIATVRHMLRTLLYLRDLNLAESVARLNTLLTTHHLLQGFTTLFVATWDVRKSTLTYVCCGQEPALVYRHTTGEMEQWGPTGPVLGIFPNAVFQEIEIPLAAGDVFAIFTDGVTEAGRDRRNLLTMEGAVALARRSMEAGGGAQEMLDRFTEGLEAFASADGLRDDVCLLLAQVQS